MMYVQRSRIGAILRCLFLVGLVAATFPIWWVPKNSLPIVPFLSCLGQAPLAFDRCLLILAALCIAGVLACAIAGSGRQRISQGAQLLAAVLLTALFFFSQQRFQPWAYQAVLLFTFFACMKEEDAFACWRWLTISIYAYSALSKLDAGFLQGLGTQMAAKLLGFLGWKNPEVEVLTITALALPMSELLVTVCLLSRRWYRVGWIGSILLHIGLVILLGPWGMNHRPGVLIWNGFFIAQNLLLMSYPRELGKQTFNFIDKLAKKEPADERNRKSMRLFSSGRAAIMGRAVFYFAMLWPLAEPWGYCDAWPAWGLYATHAARASLFLREEAAPDLPAHLQPYLTLADSAGWRQLQLDAWSLDVTNAPVYPNQRFLLALSADVVQNYGTQGDWLVHLIPRANRWNQSRKVLEIATLEQLKRAQSNFLLNAKVRFSEQPLP